MPVVEHRFDDKETLLASLQVYVVDALLKAQQQAGRASLLVSGGSTPAPLYRQLATVDLDWSAVDVALVDERWVDVADKSSNERLIKETLLQQNAAAATFYGMKSDHLDPFLAAESCNQTYSQLSHPYSVCLLGMGNDGHTASLFPHAQGLEAALESKLACGAIAANESEVTGANLLRMTLTKNAILSSEKIALLITGQQKWDVYRQALENSDCLQTPISSVLSSNENTIDIFWAP